MTTGPQFIATEHRDPKFQKVTKLEWFIGLMCNFTCTYCAEHRRSGFGDTQKMINAVDLLAQKLKERQIDLLLGGGEPSIHPDIEKICQRIHEKGIKLSMVTNGAKSPQLYVDLLKYIQHYTFSLHLEMPYQRTMETIFAVSEAIKKIENKSLLVHLMMVPGYFNEAKEAMGQFEQKGIRYILRRIRPLFDDNNKPILPKKIKDRQVMARNFEQLQNSTSDWGYYSNDELDFLRSKKGSMNKNSKEFWLLPDNNIEMRASNANEILLRKDNRFEGWSCYAGIERLHIYPQGDVYRSTCKVGGKLGNIFSDFEFPSEPVTCTRGRCTCAWAVNLSKTRNKKFWPLLRVGGGQNEEEGIIPTTHLEVNPSSSTLEPNQ